MTVQDEASPLDDASEALQGMPYIYIAAPLQPIASVAVKAFLKHPKVEALIAPEHYQEILKMAGPSDETSK